MAKSKYEYIDIYLLKDEEGNTKGITFTEDYALELANAVGWEIQEKTVEARWFDEILEDIFAHGRYIIEL